jgi:hypothetical protein
MHSSSPHACYTPPHVIVPDMNSSMYYIKIQILILDQKV